MNAINPDSKSGLAVDAASELATFVIELREFVKTKKPEHIFSISINRNNNVTALTHDDVFKAVFTESEIIISEIPGEPFGIKYEISADVAAGCRVTCVSRTATSPICNSCGKPCDVRQVDNSSWNEFGGMSCDVGCSGVSFCCGAGYSKARDAQ